MNNDMSQIPDYIKDLVQCPDGCNEQFFWFWFRQLFQKIVSVFDFDNIPETIDETFFVNLVFTLGVLPIFKNDKYGLVAQVGSPFDWDLYYRPQKIRICNRFMNEEHELGKDIELVRLTNDWSGPVDIIAHYARRLALLETSLQVAIINTKLAYVLFPSSKPAALAMEALLTKLANGQPAVLADKEVAPLQTNGTDTPFQLIQENVGQNYIIDKLMTDISRVMDEFDNEVGIPSSNTDKKERLISSEVSFGIADTVSKMDTWRRCLQDSLDKVNKLFNINITFKYNFEEIEEANTNDNNSVQDNRRSQDSSQK